MKSFYRYVYWLTPSQEPSINQRFTPSHILPRQSKLLGTICTMKDELVPEDKYKDLGGGLIADWRYGVITAEDSVLESSGWTKDAIEANAERIGSSMCIEFLTNDEMAQELRKFTNLQELQDNLFLVNPESELSSQKIPASYIDCRLS